MTQAPQDPKYISPRFPAPRSNGAREDHSPRSVLFLYCKSDTCKPEGEIREFQLMSFDSGSGLSLFRCVICGSTESLSENQIKSAQAENNKRSNRNVESDR